ncbi:MAG: membrane or secreted protein [Chitinophagaceae bacterium]
MKPLVFFILGLFFFDLAIAQQKQNPVYVDKQGVMRWTKDKSEASFFGVNYTVPFAYGYRSHKALGVDIEKAIDADIHHFQRLGLDAFRVHVWDVEISDSLGNLLENDHLRLFDYLVMKLKQKNIKILVTPIAFWGNGYPERDEKTPGFATKYGKGPSVVVEEAIKAQENYIKQFFNHVNPYTKLSYTADPDVIAAEINNEPHHSGPKLKTTEYINRLTMALRSTGWTKPVFYNISESPFYADAVVASDVQGHSFQWYPTGLVANRELKGNFLPNVDKYAIPFGDTIAAFGARAKMVYEFDAGDVMQPLMYPAMVRSYRTAGFQWATQFAYDPMYTAYGNTEYQTHYLNLAYTPAKAISLLIASKIFHKLPRNKSYGAYPADTIFDVFRLGYKEQLSLMNDDEEFYYSNNTSVQPKNISKLKHIAGVGNSPVVQYEGRGAYFLDKLSDDTWKLEVMPDAIKLRDPFERASPKKEVTRIIWRENKMQLLLPQIGGSYVVSGYNDGNDYRMSVSNNSFLIKPGVYLITRAGAAAGNPVTSREFYAPASSVAEPFMVHIPVNEVSPGKVFPITATITGLDTADNVAIELRNSSGKWKNLSMVRVNGYDYTAEVPADVITPGVINYRIMVRKADGGAYTYPGGFKGNPYTWDEYRNETWQTWIAAAESPLELFNASADRNSIMLYNSDWRNNTVEYITTDRPKQLALKANMSKPAQGKIMGWQYYAGEKISGRQAELAGFTKLVLRARSMQEMKMKLSLITVEADAYSSSVQLSKEWKEFEIPLSSLQADSFLLLPRPYPGFLPLYFKAAGSRSLNIASLEKLEFSFGDIQIQNPVSIEVESVWLKK